VEARLGHPIYDAVRPWAARLGNPSLERLNALAAEADLRTQSGRRIRFVAPGAADRSYEMRVFATGCVETRPDNLHDLFNALAWLAFPRTKARINALHAQEIPLERDQRGRKRDLLTLFDEGGAVVRCSDATLLELAGAHRWKELFWDCRAQLLRGLRISVLGHATLEQALAPWPGITCKALFVLADVDPDCAAAAWLGRLAPDATPRLLAPFPVFGYPGWHPGSEDAAFYDDARHFRPFRRPYGNTG
jgi:hypothetical protein